MNCYDMIIYIGVSITFALFVLFGGFSEFLSNCFKMKGSLNHFVHSILFFIITNLMINILLSMKHKIYEGQRYNSKKDLQKNYYGEPQHIFDHFLKNR
jgi:hypothetical protein